MGSSRLNISFLDAYIELDRVCCEKLNMPHGGATEYIHRLIDARSAPSRDDVLPRLVRYRNIRNRIAHEQGALTNITDIKKSDIRWISEFSKDVAQARDPLFLYLKRERMYAGNRKLLNAIKVGCAVLAVLAVIILAVYMRGVQ